MLPFWLYLQVYPEKNEFKAQLLHWLDGQLD
jgi:hypothetical protein